MQADTNIGIEKASALITSIGDNKCLNSILRFVNDECATVNHCSIFYHDSKGTVHHVGTESQLSYEDSCAASEQYVDLYHMFDPMRHAARLSQTDRPARLLRLNPRDISQESYRKSCFLALQTVDKLSIFRSLGQSSFSLNFYRHRKSGQFSESSVRRIDQMAQLLSAVTEKHIGVWHHLSPTPKADRATLIERLEKLSAELSPRELEICAMILLGYTSESIALSLDLSYNTILTYRRRAYLKLEITSQNELFRLCLSN